MPLTHIGSMLVAGVNESRLAMNKEPKEHQMNPQIESNASGKISPYMNEFDMTRMGHAFGSASIFFGEQQNYWTKLLTITTAVATTFFGYLPMWNIQKSSSKLGVRGFVIENPIVVYLIINLMIPFSASAVAFENIEHGFSAEFPSTVQEISLDLDSMVGTSYQSVTVKDNQTIIYAVSILERKDGRSICIRPEEETTALRLFVDANAISYLRGGKVISTKEISIGRQGLKGIEYLMSADFDGLKVMKKGYVLVARGKFFTGTVAVSESLFGQLDSRYAEFVRSIRLK